MPLVDLSHTCHTRARTGIQRVSRGLLGALEKNTSPCAITWDPWEARWRSLRSWERRNLTSEFPSSKRGVSWPLGARLAGLLRRAQKPRMEFPSCDEGILFPEIFSETVALQLSALRTQCRGPFVALFHDAIALKQAALVPLGSSARFPSYMQQLLAFDGVVAVSNTAKSDLLGYWEWLGIKQTPPVIAIAPGIEPLPQGLTPNPAKPLGEMPHILCVSTIEGRKNHKALLDACKALWSNGIKFKLTLVGLPRPETAAEALTEIRKLQEQGAPLAYLGAVADEALEEAYQACDITIYPSLEEGFGLPVAEALLRGKPCLCSGQGALGEISRGGGCLTLGQLDAGNLAASLHLLLRNQALFQKLQNEASQRRFDDWPTSAGKILEWMGSLGRSSQRSQETSKTV